LQKIHKNIIFEDYCKELADVILDIKDRKHLESYNLKENLLLPDSRQKLTMTKSEIKSKDPKRSKIRNLTDYKDKKIN
jgi:hypothetical protein